MKRFVPVVVVALGVGFGVHLRAMRIRRRIERRADLVIAQIQADANRHGRRWMD